MLEGPRSIANKLRQKAADLLRGLLRRCERNPMDFDETAERIIRKEGVAFAESALAASSATGDDHAMARRGIKEAREALKKAVVDALKEAGTAGKGR
jgi:hypothetical protein